LFAIGKNDFEQLSM